MNGPYRRRGALRPPAGPVGPGLTESALQAEIQS